VGRFALSGRTVLVTGGATGIGFECAKQLAARNNTVAICGRRDNVVQSALLELPGVRGVACDLGNDAGITHLLDVLHHEGLKVDVLINNAGIQVQTDFLADGDAVLGAMEEELRINLLGPMKLTKRLLPHLVAGRGAILNMLSLLAVMPKFNAPGYCASKAGLHAFSKSMEALLVSTGVRVFVAFPPLVETPMTRGRGSNKMSARQFVAEMLEQMAEGRAEIRVGQAKTLLALNRIAPAVALWWTRRISAGRTVSDAGR
jgi:short-subunit dehydrogenase involved in D-alanine esterification of teichoic acids